MMKWTKEEKQFVAFNYQFRTAQEIADSLGRTYISVKQYIRRTYKCRDPQKRKAIRQRKSLENEKFQARSGADSPCWKGGISKNSGHWSRIQRERYPEKNKARELFRTELRAGRIKRQPCEVCGDHRSHGHHDDYSKPYDIRWLCRQHHNAWHRAVPS